LNIAGLNLSPSFMITSIMRWICFFVLLATSQCALAQESIIVLNDSVKVQTELLSISQNDVLTKAGTFGISELFSVRFQTSENAAAKQSIVDQLLAKGIRVYAGGKRLEAPLITEAQPKKPATTEIKTKPVVDTERIPDKQKKDESNSDEYTGSVGIGFGQDYGGYGGRLTFYPDRHIGLFGSVGYILAGAGFNFGVMAHVKPENKVVPVFSVMYGYNAALKVTGTIEINKIYNGLSLGAGFISRSYANPRNYWHFGLILPFRSQEFEDDFNALKSNPFISGLEKPWPVTISVGYHFSF